uniref:Peptidase_M41 domain-containing protein n=1 Tax=Heterorhabditis bacteriophora TaxID=37862 RepID=A0A1I7XSG2_HETBA
MGPARTGGRIPDEEANRNTAFHEAGHTLVSIYTKHAVPLHKVVTIIPRGQSLGHTAMLPEKDEYQMTKGQILAALDVMMGGRVAEELAFGEEMVTTGAADDLKKASSLAVQMVKVFGMSDKVGLRDFTADDSSSAVVKVSELSPQMAEAIDKEINQVLQDSYNRAKDILTKHKVRRVISGKQIKRPTPSAVKKSNETRHHQQPLVHIHILDEGRARAQ